MWLGILNIGSGDSYARFLDDSIEHDLQKLECLVNHSLSLERAVAFEVLEVELAVAIFIAGSKKQHVLIFLLVVTVVSSASFAILIVLIRRILPRRPPLCLILCLGDRPEVALLGITVSIRIEDAEAKLPSHLYIASLQVCDECQKLLEVYNTISIEVYSCE